MSGRALIWVSASAYYDKFLLISLRNKCSIWNLNYKITLNANFITNFVGKMIFDDMSVHIVTQCPSQAYFWGWGAMHCPYCLAPCPNSLASCPIYIAPGPYNLCFCVFRQLMNCTILADLCPCFHRSATKLCPDLVSFTCWIVSVFWAFARKSGLGRSRSKLCPIFWLFAH